MFGQSGLAIGRALDQLFNGSPTAFASEPSGLLLEQLELVDAHARVVVQAAKGE